MQDSNTKKYSNDLDGEINLQELVYVLLQGKWIILSITTLISIIAVIYSLLLPNIYESRALLATVNSSGGISGAIKGYAGIARVAGLNIPSGGDEDNSSKALQKISSLSFFENKILPNIYLPDLMAVQSWNSKTKSVAYDKNFFDSNTKSWLIKPSTQESYRAFISSHLRLIEDTETGFISLSIKHQSPLVAKEWAELVVNEVNSFYREKDKLESEKAVSYINQQIAMTGLSEIKQVLAELMQEEIKKLTLIEANQFYVFDYIDPPAVMELKSEPRRSLICLFGALFGVMISTISVLIRHYFFIKKTY